MKKQIQKMESNLMCFYSITIKHYTTNVLNKTSFLMSFLTRIFHINPLVFCDNIILALFIGIKSLNQKLKGKEKVLTRHLTMLCKIDYSYQDRVYIIKFLL